jgi:hypothetical protein
MAGSMRERRGVETGEVVEAEGVLVSTVDVEDSSNARGYAEFQWRASIVTGDTMFTTTKGNKAIGSVTRLTWE